MSRLGRGALTGIDRVERAYLSRFLQEPVPVFGLMRSAAGWLLLDRAGCEAFARLTMDGSALPQADLLSRFLHRHDPLRARAESAARKLAIARAARPGLGRLLRGLPRPAMYFNVGHANLTASGLAATKAAGLAICVMVHDTIPLDHPDFARGDTIASFRRKMRAVAAHADQVIHLATATRQTTEAQLANLGRVPPGITAHLGIDMAPADLAALPSNLNLSQPYFVTIGTIEPRKNHNLLLDVWARLPPPRPRLFIIGNRGWATPELFHRLDAFGAEDDVQVIHGLTDGAVTALVRGATALLAPSHAEGFGLPPVEAASLGTPVIATDLKVTRELLGDKAVYLPASDIYSWLDTIVSQTNASTAGIQRSAPMPLFTWEAHFKQVLSLGC